MNLDEGFIEDEDKIKNIRRDRIGTLQWRCKGRRVIMLKDMEDRHIRNIALMLMGLSYQTYKCDDKTKIVWLTALRIEWERRMIAGKNKMRVWKVPDEDLTPGIMSWRLDESI